MGVSSNHPVPIVSHRVKQFLRGLSLFILSLAASCLLVLSFPPYHYEWLAWIALVPLLVVSLTTRPAGAFFAGLLAGTVGLLLISTWIFEVPGFRFYHAMPLAAFYGLFPALWCAGVAWIHRRKPSSVLLAAPSLWVFLGFLQNHLGFLSFTWATLARSQYAHPALLQIAAFTGEYGVTFLVVMINAALAGILLRRAWKQAVISGGLIGLSLLWGTYRLTHPIPAPRTRVAVVQPSILLEERKMPQTRAAARKRLEMLTERAAAFRPELIVWPETSIRDLRRHPELVHWLNEIAARTRAALLVGASEFVKFGDGNLTGKGRIHLKVRQFNAAWFFNPAGDPFVPYHKRLLVPFGEYVPLASVVSWPAWLVPTSIHGLPGNTYRSFPLTGGHHVTPIICWENLFPAFVRKAVRHRADMVAHLVNDNWFGKTAAPSQHNMASVLRAVENRVPVVVASNTGPSEIIDPYGRVLAEAPGLFQPCMITAEVAVPKTRTLFTRWGEFFPFLCLLVVVVSSRLHARPNKKRRNPPRKRRKKGR